MKILFISQYFPPEIEPSASKIYDLSKNMVEIGHKVTVITGFPNYPTGIVPKEYRKKLFMTEKTNGINVIRVPIIPSQSKQFLRRIIGEVSFLLSSVIASILIRKCDAVVTSSPPLEVGLAGYIISRIKGTAFIFEVRDPLPKQAINVGILKNKVLIRIAEWIENLCYEKSDRIVVVTQGVREHVISKGIRKEKLALIPNGADIQLFSSLKGDDFVRERYNLGTKFVVSYIGTMGLKHNTVSIIETAAILRNERNIVFLLVGEGAEKEILLRIKEEKGLNNVVFEAPQPRSKIPYFINASNACIVTLRKDPFLEGSLHVKMFEYMACERPVILSANGETKELLEKADAGIWVEPEEPKEMAKAVLRLYGNRRLCKAFGENGRRCVIESFSREELFKKYANVLEKATNER